MALDRRALLHRARAAAIARRDWKLMDTITRKIAKLEPIKAERGRGPRITAATDILALDRAMSAHFVASLAPEVIDAAVAEAEAMGRFRERLETAGPDAYVLMAAGDQYSEINRAFFKIRAASDRATRRKKENETE